VLSLWEEIRLPTKTGNHPSAGRGRCACDLPGSKNGVCRRQSRLTPSWCWVTFGEQSMVISRERRRFTSSGESASDVQYSASVMLNPRKLAAIDVAFLGARLIIAEYAIGVLLSVALCILTLGVYLILLGINYVPMLAYAVAISMRGSALAEVDDELNDQRCAMAKYRRQSTFLLVPLMVAITALRQGGWSPGIEGWPSHGLSWPESSMGSYRLTGALEACVYFESPNTRPTVEASLQLSPWHRQNAHQRDSCADRQEERSPLGCAGHISRVYAQSRRMPVG
jgi:hypothetical protein